MKHIFTIILCLLVKITISQNVPFQKDIFSYDKDGFKEAVKDLEEGEYLLSKDSYHEALGYLLAANSFNEANASLNYNIGICYLFDIERYKSLDYFKKAEELDPYLTPELSFVLGQGYHLNSKFDLAIDKFETYISKSEAFPENVTAATKFIQECKSGKELINKSSRAFMDNMGGVINSEYDDHSPLISADAAMLIFTSSRENGKRPDVSGLYDEDIFVSYRQGIVWTPAQDIGEPINTPYNDATVGLSPDGQTLLIYNGKRGNGDIQICRLNGEAWDYPKNLPKSINTDYRESSACYSPDGNILYFISDRPDGIGGRDIWMSSKDRKGKWGDARNLSSVINSPYDEETVYMHPDGRTLYFSSKGHNNMGGFDVFVSRRDAKGQWSEPENLGSPINSPDDDLCFVISANGRYGYSSSSRSAGMGGFDVYKMTFLGPEKPLTLSTEDNLISVREKPVAQVVLEENVELKTIRLTIVKGTVLNAFTQEPISASIDIIDNEKNEVIFTSQSNSASGKFLVSLPSGKNYGLIVRAEDYLFHSENFNIPAATEYREITKEIDLASVKKDVKIILKNVFFESGSSTLKPTSYAELGRLTKMLQDYPNLIIEISGHTDNRGSANANQSLSKLRAKAVVDFLISEGNDASRLEFKGYGFEQPVADNATADGRAQNRRVEFKIISN